MRFGKMNRANAAMVVLSLILLIFISIASTHCDRRQPYRSQNALPAETIYVDSTAFQKKSSAKHSKRKKHDKSSSKDSLRHKSAPKPKPRNYLDERIN